MKKRFYALLLSAALLSVLTACGGAVRPTSTPTPQRQSQVGFYFDTVVTMEVYTNDETLLADAQAACQRYDDLLSKTHEGSDVWNINHAEGKRVAVSDETREILEREYMLDGGTFEKELCTLEEMTWGPFTGYGVDRELREKLDRLLREVE